MEGSVVAGRSTGIGAGVAHGRGSYIRTTTDARGDTTTTTFDKLGRRKTQTDPNGHETKYTYDADGRLETETTPIGTTTTYTYDPAGDRATRVDASNRTTSYHYDPNRRLLEKDLPGGVVHSFKYDSRGNRTYEADPAVARTRIYDTLSRLQAVTDHALQKTIDYQYDENGNRTKLTWDGKAIAYRYDQMSRLVEVTDPDGGHAHLTYDLSGRRTSLRFANGILATYSYDGAGRLTDIVYTKPDGTVVESFHYELDHAGNRLTKGFADGTREVYVYDADDRLTEVTYGDGRKVSYNLDAVGNRQALRELNPNGTVGRDETYRYNAFNQLTTRHISTGYPNATNETYGYDPQGAMTSKVAQITTGAGTTTETTTYAYNTNERLSGVTLPDGSQDSFAYDPNGLRVTSTTPAATEHYLRDGSRVLLRLVGSGQESTAYIADPQRLDEVLAGLVTDSSGHTSRIIPIIDLLGSVFLETNQSASVTARLSYTPFGSVSMRDGVARLDRAFTGRPAGPSGLLYNRQRHLDTSTGTWTRPDPYGEAAGPNAYLYVNDRVTKFVDPSGLDVYVLMWGARVKEGTFGHAAIGVTDGPSTLDVFGLWPKPGRYYQYAAGAGQSVPAIGEPVPAIALSAVGTYGSREGRPADAIIRLLTTPQEDQDVRKLAKLLSAGNYNLYSNNCTDYVASALHALSFDVTSVYETVRTSFGDKYIATPRHLWRVLYLPQYKRGGLGPLITIEVVREPHGTLGGPLPYEVWP